MSSLDSEGLQYCEVPPPRGLEAAIECLWWLRAPRTDDPPAERVLPDGSLELVFHLGDGYQRLTRDGPQTQPRSLLVGPMRAHMMIRPLGAADLLGIRLKPAGAPALLDLPLSEIRDVCLSLEDLGTRFATNLWQQLGHAPAPAARLKVLAHAVQTACRVDRIDPAAAALCSEMKVRGGSLHVERLADLAGLSTRTLERLFNVQVGLPPKLLSRIFRLQQVIRRAGIPTPASLRDAALDAGYFDQAHFLRDFKALAGVSPSTFFSIEENRMSEAFRSQKAGSPVKR